MNKQKWRKFRYQFLHLQGGNWWRWPVTLAVRVPISLLGMTLEWIVNLLQSIGDKLPGVSERPGSPPMYPSPRA